MYGNLFTTVFTPWNYAFLTMWITQSLWESSFSQSLPAIGLKQRSTGERVFIEIDSGREIYFHGVNAVVKGFPYIPETDVFDIDTSLADKDHSTLADLGMNVYRLGTMWKGVEPNMGEYNDTYIKKVFDIVSAAEKYGIYTLFDMHQDVMSEKFCGEGVPDFAADPKQEAMNTFPVPQQEEPYMNMSTIDGYPTRQDCGKHGWASYYQTKEAASAFEALYTDFSPEGLMTSWGEFWKALASATVSSKSRNAVLGYELINEPYAGDIFNTPKLLIPSVADRERLQPAYDFLAKAIRSVDRQTLLFFAAVTWDDIVPIGFDHAPGGESEAAGSVFTYHYYEPPQGDELTYFRVREKDARRLQVGWMLTEFERPQNNNDTVNDPFVHTADMLDVHLQSWTMWEYKTFCKESETSATSDSQSADFGSCKTGYGEHLIWDNNGNFNYDPARKLARTYARKVAGELLSLSFDADSGSFAMTYVLNKTISYPTEVFAHMSLNYPLGLIWVMQPAGIVTVEQKGNLIYLTPIEDALDGEKVIFTIQRAVTSNTTRSY